MILAPRQYPMLSVQGALSPGENGWIIESDQSDPSNFDIKEELDLHSYSPYMLSC
jgi:hypothetical protein